MKIRPQKNVRQGLVGGRGRGRGRVNQPKSRKELRKEKRQQKKINRFNYHNRSRKERYENAAGGGKNGSKKAGEDADSEDEEFHDNDVDDEEIDSDLCSGGEDEKEDQQQQGQQRPKSALLTNQLDVEREKEMMELRQYEESLKKKRIDQLEAANEEDDRIIKKYEKLLHINRRKNKEGVPKSFDDGLDYALELCTDDSIRKMYEAAKEAAELEENSSDEFVEDLQQAVGAGSGVAAATNGKSVPSGEQSGVAETETKLSQKERRRVENLRRIEEKHLGLDEIDDLGAYDSELEIEMDEEQDGDMDSDYSESDELYSGTDDEGSSGAEEDQDNQRKRKVKFAVDSKPAKNGKKRKTSSYESDEDETSEQDEEADEQQKPKKGEKENSVGRFVLLNPTKKKVKKATEAKKAKKSKKSTESDEYTDSDDDAEDEDDGLDDLLDGLDSEGSLSEDGGSDSDGDGKATNGDGTWEDIYGRKRDKSGNVIKEETAGAPGTGGGKYVPPHLRAKQEAQSSALEDPKRQEKLLRLKRQLKGQVNRLAESNVHRISIELDNLYMQNARFDMNSTLTSLLLEVLVAPTLIPERMVLEHMLLVAILHANVGSEVGSHFLETVVERFLALLQTIATEENEAKQLDNCVQILCHLYTFDIVKGKLVYEMLQKLLECFNEKAVECILLVLRTIGFILRKDDPLALKDLIVTIQKKAANAPEELRKDTRVKFMLETLLAVKNNNMHKIPAYDPTLVEHFRKLLKGMITNGKYVSTMNIGLDDIVNIPERGKWWLVGSAWHGAPSAIAGKTPDAAGRDASGGQFSEQLLELARQQRMNTDDRRNVFCIVMSAEDYLDAFEKLLRLAIKDLRIVVSVIMHCSLAEKEYNPYYSVLSQKFCEYDRRYQLAIQFALWDRLKEVHSLKPQQLRNLARFITHLIGEGGLPLSCLKVVDFADLDKVSLRLMRQVMLGLLLPVEENKCLQVFSRITASYKLKAFKDSLRLFMHHFLARGSASHKQLPEDQVQLLQQRIKQADQLLATEDSRIQFDDE
ncbi:nucleolar MIF4G domain-containing protein 1 homolog [Anopheles darlingi]|uniref:nucleolar MIF4G domain-containing protein 1 homolog n=1 Tax=Anopheles darlingi TaxID=43151 RepID=UPI0021001F68|nr:nucleolar MIF4G domain-containing protein 1 homolog [Anopheles darlingi]